jgi:RNA polymerase sigma factor (sigma-70 family)
VRGTTRRRRRESAWSDVTAATLGADAGDSSFEPALVAALGRLTTSQRVAVVLVHCYGYTLAEAADVQGCSVSTLRNHLSRGLAALRTALGVVDA